MLKLPSSSALKAGLDELVKELELYDNVASPVKKTFVNYRCKISKASNQLDILVREPREVSIRPKLLVTTC